MRYSLRSLLIVTALTPLAAWYVGTQPMTVLGCGGRTTYSMGTATRRTVWQQEYRCDGVAITTLFRDLHCAECGRDWTRTEIGGQP